MTRLVHECATIKFPGAAPGSAVVILLRARPEHIDVDHVYPAKSAKLHGALKQLQGGVAPVLFYDEKANVGIVAGFHHPQAIVPARGHGFFGHDISTRRGNFYGLFRV